MLHRTIEYSHESMRKYPHRATVRWVLFGRVISERKFGCNEFSAYWHTLPDCGHASVFASVVLNGVRRRVEFEKSEGATP